jgi:hypothetical protein
VYVYLAENAGETVAERFFASAEKSFADLARQPMMDSPVKLGYPEPAGLRKWSIDGNLLLKVPRSRKSARDRRMSEIDPLLSVQPLQS